MAGPLDESAARAPGEKLHMPHPAGAPEFESALRRDLRVLVGDPAR